MDERGPYDPVIAVAARAQIIEVVDMQEIAAERTYEFAFLGSQAAWRATVASLPSYAVPLRG